MDIKNMNKWYEKAVFYHMYPLGMVGAAKQNTEDELVHRFDELEKWVPHIKSINCDAIYIGPLFESTTHGYDTRDYKIVDRRLGDNDDFKHFVSLCHESGIKVVVDGVFNHTGREFFAFKDIRQNREQSPYRYWYKDVNFGGNSPYGDSFSYAAWRGHFELANLNLYDRSVKDYLLDVIRFWIKEFDIDGIRLDCADCLEFEFMKEMRSVTEQEKEDFWLMGEVIHGDYARWVKDEQLHSVTNYELHKGLYSGHNDQNYFEIAHTIKRQFDENGGIYKGCRLYSFVDNHDVDRIISKLKNKAHLLPIYILLYTLPGIPSIYYGSEWGVEGKKENNSDDNLRPALNVEEMEKKNEYPELTELITKLGKIKQENEALTAGRYRELVLKNKQYAFARITETESVIIAVNNDEEAADFDIQLPNPAEEAIDLLTGEKIPVSGGKVTISVEGCSGMLIKIN